jgi:hypothetical protein
LETQGRHHQAKFTITTTTITSSSNFPHSARQVPSTYLASSSHTDILQILPPPLHSAIDPSPEGGTQNHSGDGAIHISPILSRNPGSEVPSPIYSQTSSMPDSFDELGQRNYDSCNQYQRNSSTWSTTSTYPDMAASYQQRPSFPNAGLGGPKQFSSLPPIRDPYDSGYVTSTSQYPVYNTSPQAQTPMDYTMRQQQTFYNGDISSTYPGAQRNSYAPEKYALPYPAQGYGSRHSTYGYHQRYHQDFGSPMHHNGMVYPPMDQDGRSGKKRRGNLPKHTTDTLRSWLHEHVDHPYPTEEQKQHLMSITGLTMSQVSLNE